MDPLVEGAPIPKRMRLRHSFEARNKACLILRCLDPEQPCRPRIEYNIFIVDDLNADIIDGDGFSRVPPTFQIDCGRDDFAPDAFCVLGGKLYMFEGCIESKGCVTGDVSGKSVFAVDLALTHQTLTREERRLEKGGPVLKKVGVMSSPKSLPVALPTPDGRKIVVLPTSNTPGSAFELFEPSSGSWEQLPSIPGIWFTIYLYGFIDIPPRKRLLLVQAQSADIYAIDLASPPDDRHWEKLGASEFFSGLSYIPPQVLETSFFEAVLGRRFCFVNLFGFYDLEDHVGEDNPRNLMDYGFSSPEYYDLGLRRGHTADSCVGLLDYDEDGKEIRYCDLMMEKPTGGCAESCRLAIFVCRVDLESYEEERKQMKDEGWACTSSFIKRSFTTIVKAHKFTLVFDGPCNVDPPYLFFTF